MTEQTPQNAPQNITVPMTVLNQYVKDLSFENPNAPGILTQLAKGPPQVNLNVTVGYRLLGNPPTPQAPVMFEGTLTIKAEGTIESQPAFVAECVYAGAFALPQGIPDQVVRGLLMVEAPRLLFPFARQIASDCVQGGGYGPLLISPVDFLALYQQQLKAEQLAGSQQAGNA